VSKRRSRPAEQDRAIAYRATPTTGLCVIDHGLDADGQPRHVGATDGQLCAGHRFDLDQVCRDISELWFDLAFMVEPNRGAGVGRRAVGAAPPVPIDVVSAALRDHRNPNADVSKGDIPSVPGVVASFAQLLIEERHLTQLVHVPAEAVIYGTGPFTAVHRPAHVVERLIGPRSMIAQLDLLFRHNDWIAEQDWAVNYWRQMTDVRDALRVKVGDDVLGLSQASPRTIALSIVKAGNKK
jgi:hypothetical protein